MVTGAAKNGEPANHSRRDMPYLVLLTIIFAAAHAMYYTLLGIRFEGIDLVQWYLHYADFELLRTRLLETCWRLHTQPPLMNYFVGAVLKIFPDNPDPAFHIVYIGCAYGLVVSLFALLRRMGVGPRLAAALCALFMLSPAFIVYEHWLFYTLPSALLLTASALTFARFAEHRRLRDAWMFFTLLLLLCATRSLFHLVFFLAAAGGVVWLSAGRRGVAVAALLPLLILIGLYVKNAVLFGEFNLSSFMGRNLWIKAVGNMNWNERRTLVEQGALSELSLIERWSPIEKYPPRWQGPESHTGVPALDRRKKANGAENFNHIAHIAISRQYMADSLYALRRHPKAFLSATWLAWMNYFRPYYPVSEDNRRKLGAWGALYDYAVFGRSPIDLRPYSGVLRAAESPPYWFTLLGLPFLWLYAAYLLARSAKRRGPLRPEQALTLGYMLFCIAYVAMVGTTFELGETSRFRFLTDPLHVVLLGLFVGRFLIPRIAARWRRKAGA